MDNVQLLTEDKRFVNISQKLAAKLIHEPERTWYGSANLVALKNAIVQRLNDMGGETVWDEEFDALEQSPVANNPTANAVNMIQLLVGEAIISELRVVKRHDD